MDFPESEWYGADFRHYAKPSDTPQPGKFRMLRNRRASVAFTAAIDDYAGKLYQSGHLHGTSGRVPRLSPTVFAGCVRAARAHYDQVTEGQPNCVPSIDPAVCERVAVPIGGVSGECYRGKSILAAACLEMTPVWKKIADISQEIRRNRVSNPRRDFGALPSEVLGLPAASQVSEHERRVAFLNELDAAGVGSVTGAEPPALPKAYPRSGQPPRDFRIVEQERAAAKARDSLAPG